jgi:hypothetical protein
MNSDGHRKGVGTVADAGQLRDEFSGRIAARFFDDAPGFRLWLPSIRVAGNTSAPSALSQGIMGEVQPC